MRFVPLLLLAGPAFAVDPSVTCTVEMTRREAVMASDTALKQPPGQWWVGVEGKSLGPWTVIEVKRRMARGDIASDVWVYPVGKGVDWVLTSQTQDFLPLPLPGPAELAPGQPLATVLTGCWVSDPIAETPGDETTWMLVLFDNGNFSTSRGVLTAATGREQFRSDRTTQTPWRVNGDHPESFTLSLPDITYLEPQGDFQARLIDTNQLLLTMPTIGEVTFRRM